MRPIDLQDNFSKAPLASREQQIQQNSADQAQRQGALRLDDEHALDQSRTTPTDETDGPENRVDRETDSGAHDSSQRREHEEGDGETDDGAQASMGVSPNSRDIDVVV